MAAIDFPAAPTVGQLFVAGNGVTYQWTGVLWLAVATQISVAFKTGTPVAHSPAEWSLWTQTWSSVAFNNGGGAWSGSAYTVPQAGLYDVEFQLAMDWPADAATYPSQGEAHLFINGASVALIAINHAVAPGPIRLNYPMRWRGYLAVNDVLTFRGMFGGKLATAGNTSAAACWASVVKLGN